MPNPDPDPNLPNPSSSALPHTREDVGWTLSLRPPALVRTNHMHVYAEADDDTQTRRTFAVRTCKHCGNNKQNLSHI
jgi:hypothetical protein